MTIDHALGLIDACIADPRRICLYGASYGAYASMVAAASEPSLYACAIGNVGVYDLRRLVADGAFGRSWRGFDELFGKGADLESISPTTFAAKIRVPSGGLGERFLSHLGEPSRLHDRFV